MDQIRASLENINELDDAALEQLAADIVSEFESVESADLTAESVETMTELANAADAVNAARDERTAKAAELQAAAEEASTRIRGAKSEGVAEDEALEDTEDEQTASAEPADPADEEELDKKKKKKKIVEEEPVFADNSADDNNNELSADAEGTETSKVETELSADEPEAEATEEAAAEEPKEEAAEEVVEPEVQEAEESKAEEVDSAEDADADKSETEENREDSEATVTAAANEELDIQAPEDRRPSSDTTANARATVSITAGADIQGITAGTDLPSMKAVSEAFATRMHSMRRTSGGDGEQFTVATLAAEYPEERTLRSNEIEQNVRKIADVASPQAVTAAGGFCAPVEVSYDIFGFGTTDRPVKDALASFSADRGGIRYTTSPVLGDLDGAVSTWTLQDDIDASTPGNPNPTKPCLRVNCGEEVVVHVDAIPLCLTFGNLQSRAFPEMVERNNELALITHARYSEQRLLTRIGALSTTVSATSKLGGARDFFNQVDLAAAGYRNRHRLSPTETLRVIAPSWLLNLVRSDIVMNMPGDGRDDAFGLAQRTVDAWFRARNINPSWTLDGEAGQIFGEQNNGQLNAFPENVVWYLFAEGTFLFLDGGTLDLGLVRDSSLNATNDYKMFVETFEGVAKVGIESLRVASRLKVNGAVAGTVDPATL